MAEAAYIEGLDSLATEVEQFDAGAEYLESHGYNHVRALADLHTDRLICGLLVDALGGVGRIHQLRRGDGT